MAVTFSACISLYKNSEDYFYSVFELICTEEGRFDSAGTAFKCDGVIYTNAHIVSYTKDQEKALYSSIKGNIYNSLETISFQVININFEKDIAILYPTENLDAFNKIPSLSFNELERVTIGQDVFTIGNLNGYGLALNKGHISSKPKLMERNGIESYYLQTSIEISKGSSGGPVIESSGKVIGMMTFKVRDSNGEYVDGMSFAIPSTDLLRFTDGENFLLNMKFNI